MKNGLTGQRHNGNGVVSTEVHTAAGWEGINEVRARGSYGDSRLHIECVAGVEAAAKKIGSCGDLGAGNVCGDGTVLTVVQSVPGGVAPEHRPRSLGMDALMLRGDVCER